MSPELANAQSYLIAGSAVGYVGGAIAEQLAIRHSQANRQRLSEVPELALRPEQPQQLSRFQRLGFVASAFAGVSAVSLGIEAYANAPGPVIEHDKPKVYAVIDHSAATAFQVGNHTATDEINHIAEGLADSKIDTHALVARSGDFKPVKIEDVAKNKPFGDAPLDKAVSFALTDSSFGETEAKNVKKHASGMLIITNGNEIGVPKEVAQDAAAEGIPLFIVNVAPAQESTQTTIDGLKTIASSTKGKYWDLKSTDLDSVTSDVQGALVPKKVDRGEMEGRNALRTLGAIGLFSVVGLFRKRRNYTTGKRA